MVSYLKNYNATVTPQSQPIPGSKQVQNSAGGYAWEITPWQRAERFLILGSESNTYYTSGQDLTRQNAKCIEDCIREDGPRLVQLVTDISVSGRAPKNDPALFALAMAISLGDNKTKNLAAERLSQVARIGTHILHFAQYASQFRGWGPTLMRAVQNWFILRRPQVLLYQAVKYPSRDGWALRDLLRLSHPKVFSEEGNLALRYIVKGEVPEDGFDVFEQIRAIRAIQAPDAAIDDAAHLIAQYRIPREAVPTHLLKYAAIWQALVLDMPQTALIRNVATMTRNGALSPTDFELISTISERLTDRERIKRARVHPLAYLVALNTYASGKSVRGSGTWEPIQKVADALNDGFYAAFDALVPTNKRILLGVDVSGSMSYGTIAGLPGVTPRAGACALALQMAKTEPNSAIMGFTSGFVPLRISPSQRLDDVVKYTSVLGFERTDCSQPMLWAQKNRASFDAFVIVTDSETWHGSIHPMQALQQYRKDFVVDAKLIVIGMTATEFSIADPNDAYSMDVVGFDTAAPAIIGDFVRGESVPASTEDEDLVS